MLFNKVAAGAGVGVTLKLSNILDPTILVLCFKSLTDENRGQLQHIKGCTLEVEEGSGPQDSPPRLSTPEEDVAEWPLAFFKPVFTRNFRVKISHCSLEKPGQYWWPKNIIMSPLEVRSMEARRSPF
eukprot:7044700-Pyramimonas_sp.AAC.1